MKDFLETIGQATFECFKSETNTMTSINNALLMIKDSYTLVEWPEVQELMEEDWFEKEAVLNLSTDASSSYFIPIKYLIN